MPLPAQSLRGDVELALDTGENIRVHSLLLELASPVLSDALKVARDAHTAPDPCEPVRLPMPSVSVKEARMLLQVCCGLSLLCECPVCGLAEQQRVISTGSHLAGSALLRLCLCAGPVLSAAGNHAAGAEHAEPEGPGPRVAPLRVHGPVQVRCCSWLMCART